MKKTKRSANKKGNHSKLRATVKWGALAFVLFCLVIGIWAMWGVGFGFGDSIEQLNLHLTSVVYYKDAQTGEYVEFERILSKENRVWKDYDEMPQNMKDAAVAIEDQRFYTHHGMDLKRTMGAALNVIFKGDSSYGGSTITQQLVKNLTGDRDKSYVRKAREIIRALILETKLSKDQILELYLNSIYLGQGCNGVESAANMYFGKTVSELTLAECASIAGITQFPSLYDPLVNPEKNKEKQELVLAKMLELGYIDQSEHDTAVAEKLNIVPGQQKERRSGQSYFVDQLIEDIIDQLVEQEEVSETIAEQMLYNSGLKIYATVDPRIQEIMNDVYENPDNFPKLSGEVQPESAMVISDPYTGEVKGVVGGRGVKSGSRLLNRATQSKRQPGSTIKPISVYGPAVDLGVITGATQLMDERININGWSPKNYYSGFYGPMTVRRAIEQSSNIPAVKALQKLGVEESFKYMTERLGFTTLVNRELQDGKVYSDKNLSSLALGGLTHGVIPMEMNAAFGAFVNKGVYMQPIMYTHVEDSKGRKLLECHSAQKTAFREDTAYIMCQLLKSVVDRGTGVGAKISGMDTAGKTGTTDDDMDRWFIGFTPYYTGTVWFGYDANKGLPALSSNPALRAWKKVMDQVHAPLPNKSFERPKGVISATVCTSSGMLAGENCLNKEGKSLAVTEYFRKGTAPSGICNIEHEVPPVTENPEGGVIDLETGELVVPPNGTAAPGTGETGTVAPSDGNGATQPPSGASGNQQGNTTTTPAQKEELGVLDLDMLLE